MDTHTFRRVPATVANRKGHSYIDQLAQEQTVIVTKHNKPVSVTMSPERYDEMVRTIRETTDSVLATAAELVAERSTYRSLDEAKAHLADRA